jgi:hypothetical protein
LQSAIPIDADAEQMTDEGQESRDAFSTPSFMCYALYSNPMPECRYEQSYNGPAYGDFQACQLALSLFFNVGRQTEMTAEHARTM